LNSTSTQAVNCAQAIQTSTPSTLRKTPVVISSWSICRLGASLGSGQPMKYARDSGTPTTSAASAINATNAFITSPKDRPTRTGTGERFPLPE
jgi:hypothetical protein